MLTELYEKIDALKSFLSMENESIKADQLKDVAFSKTDKERLWTEYQAAFDKLIAQNNLNEQSKQKILIEIEKLINIAEENKSLVYKIVSSHERFIKHINSINLKINLDNCNIYTKNGLFNSHAANTKGFGKSSAFAVNQIL